MSWGSGRSTANYSVLGRFSTTKIVERLLARDLSGGAVSEVVLDRLIPELKATKARAVLAEEAERLKALRHPNLQAVLAVDEIEGDLVVAEEVLPTVTLQRLCVSLAARGGRLPLPMVLRIFLDVVSALEKVHDELAGAPSKGAHTGVSWTSVGLGYDGRVRLSSPLLPRTEHRLIDELPELVKSGGAYTAPEQRRGTPIDPRADIYSIGVMLYQLALLAESGINRLLEDERVQTTIIDQSLPLGLGAIIRRALSEDSAKRHKSCAELREDVLRLAHADRAPGSQEGLGQIVRGTFAELFALETSARERSDRELLCSLLDPNSPSFDGTMTGSRSDSEATVFMAQSERGAGPESVRLTRSPQGVIVHLSGPVDEKLVGKRIAAMIADAETLIFDLDQVTRVTSYGVREWLAMLDGIKASYYCFIKARPAVVMQFNVVTYFSGRGEVISGYAPYVCGSCGEAIDLLVDFRTQRHMLHSSSYTKEIPCPKCGKRAEFDDIPEAYFVHASMNPPPNPPPNAAMLIDGAAPTSEPFKVVKDVAGAVTALWFSGRLDERSRFKRLADGLEGTVIIEASKISSLDESGVRRLLDFVSTSGVGASFARVTPELAIALARSNSPVAAGSVLSALVDFACGGCDFHGLVEVEAPFTGLSEKTQLCHECFGGTMHASPLDVHHQALLAIGAPHVPDVAAMYLMSHTSPPSPRAGATSKEQLPALEDGSLFGKYRLIERIGSGGMAEVYLARQVGLAGFEKHVAVKRILPKLADKADLIELFLAEARLAARLSHPNIVQIFDLGKYKNDYFIAMEYVKGWDLAKLLVLCKRLDLKFPIDLIARVVADVCAALSFAHGYADESGNSTPIIHRDVSPHNVLVASSGTVKLADFGIASVTGTPGQVQRAGASESELRGKFAYMAPERMRSEPVSDIRSDIFSAGVVLYESLTLRRLFRRENHYSTMMAVLHEDAPSARSARPEVPEALDAIVQRAVAKSPEDRYASAEEMQLALESFLASRGAPITAGQVASWLRALLTKAAGTAEAEGTEP
jgi:serine/threonine protein kinase